MRTYSFALPTLAFLLPVGLMAFTALTACTASLDLERFQEAQSSSGNVTTPGLQYYDFKLAATSMASHTNEYFEMRLVNKGNQVVSKAIYDGVTQVAFNLYMKRWIPVETTDAPYRIDFWADHNGPLGSVTHQYGGIVGDVATKDHAWRRVLGVPLPSDVTLKGDRYELDFLHDTTFVDIATDLNGQKLTGDTTVGDGIPGDASLLPIQLKVVGVETTNFIGKKIELRVFDKASNHMVAMHRRGRAAEGYIAEVFGVLDEQTTYIVQGYVDLDEDGLFNPGNQEPSWSTEITSTAAGIQATFDISILAVTPIETGDLTAAAK